MILLSFDIEEFDLPTEYGMEISFEAQLSVSREGTETILRLLKKHDVKATFYCTAHFAIHQTGVISAIADNGHEIASHGYYHGHFELQHLVASKTALEVLTGKSVSGYRAARMMFIPESEITKAGYTYNSSLNPTFLPGRYNKFGEPRTWFYREGILQLPASVSPVVRFPLFWLSFHNLPLGLYCRLCQWTLRKDGYLNIYFHPWEFCKIDRYNFPGYVVRNSGKKMEERFEKFILWAKSKGHVFGTTSQFLEDRKIARP